MIEDTKIPPDGIAAQGAEAVERWSRTDTWEDALPRVADKLDELNQLLPVHTSLIAASKTASRKRKRDKMSKADQDADSRRETIREQDRPFKRKKRIGSPHWRDRKKPRFRRDDKITRSEGGEGSTKDKEKKTSE